MIFASVAVAKDTVKYSITDISWEPYWIVNPHSVSGILYDVIIELDKRIDTQLIPIKPLPVKRVQAEFKSGFIIIDCCLNKYWRADPDQVAVSLWSDTVLQVDEILIFPKGKSFPFKVLSDLKDKRIATVLGYGYVGSEYFIRNDSTDNISQILRVATGRFDAGIIDQNEFNYMIKINRDVQNAIQHITIGPVINHSELRIRVHHTRPDLLAPINKALAVMRTEGTIKRIVARYRQ